MFDSPFYNYLAATRLILFLDRKRALHYSRANAHTGNAGALARIECAARILVSARKVERLRRCAGEGARVPSENTSVANDR